MDLQLAPIAVAKTDFPDKFGIPRQSGLVPQLRARVVFTPEFRDPALLRGLEGFTHIWLIWHFSGNRKAGWSPMVRPPRLGGNRRMGVFATRSPFRPNPIGLSCVRLEAVIPEGAQGPELLISGADLMDGTPILDIKPYIPYADCHPEASGGFTDSAKDFLLRVDFPEALLSKIPEALRAPLLGVLSHDPRPSYQKDPKRVYGLSFGGWNIRFRVEEDLLAVISVEPLA